MWVPDSCEVRKIGLSFPTGRDFSDSDDAIYFVFIHNIGRRQCMRSDIANVVNSVRPFKFSLYDTRCYFNVRSKADISQLNLPHGTDN